MNKQLFTPMISEVANRNLALRFAVPSQDRVKRVAGKGSAFVGNMIIPLCRMARIRAANFTSCARVPLQDNETIHKLSTVLLYSSAAIDRSQFLSFASCFLSPPPRDKPKEIHPVSFISSLPDNVNFYRVVETRQIGRLRFLVCSICNGENIKRIALPYFPTMLVYRLLKLEQRVSTYYSPVFSFFSSSFLLLLRQGKVSFSCIDINCAYRLAIV